MIPAYLINCRKYLASVKWGDMHDVETVLRNLIEITEVRLACGWRGWVAVREAGRERFSKSGWESLLAEPEKLLEGSGNILKSEGDNVVMIKYLATGGRGVKAVIKRHRRGRGLREFLGLWGQHADFGTLSGRSRRGNTDYPWRRHWRGCITGKICFATRAYTSVNTWRCQPVRVFEEYAGRQRRAAPDNVPAFGADGRDFCGVARK